MSKPLNIIAVIPARYAASRFPAKLMQDLNGKTVIRRTYEATLNTELFDQVLVVTDSDIIDEEIAATGGKIIRSKKEHQCGSDRIAEAVEFMDVDIVVNVQGDEPFTNREDLANLIEVFKNDPTETIDLASIMTPINDTEEINSPNTVKVIVNKNSEAIYFSRAPIPYLRATESGYTYFKHRGIYAFRKKALIDFYHTPMTPLEMAEKIECLRYIEAGKKIKMIKSPYKSVEIDTPEDLNQARKLLNS